MKRGPANVVPERRYAFFARAHAICAPRNETSTKVQFQRVLACRGKLEGNFICAMIAPVTREDVLSCKQRRGSFRRFASLAQSRLRHSRPPTLSIPPPYGYGHPTYNGCPPGYTIQGGNCAPYQGHGGGWNTYNGCPPGYTIQGGACKPYQGHRRY